MNLDLTKIDWTQTEWTPRLVLYRPSNIVGRAITWQTDGVVSHAAILWPGNLLSEATWPKVRVRPFGDKAEGDDTAEVYVICGWSLAGCRTAASFAQAQVGKPYDLLGLARFLTRGFAGFQRFYRRSEGSFQNPKRWFCSDYAFRTCQVGGVNLLHRVDYYKVSPEQLRRSIGMFPLNPI